MARKFFAEEIADRIQAKNLGNKKQSIQNERRLENYIRIVLRPQAFPVSVLSCATRVSFAYALT